MSLVTLQMAPHVAVITLNRPTKRNALSKALLHELIAAVAAAESDGQVRVIRLQGAGAHFCGGADIAWMRDALHTSAGENLADAKLLSTAVARLANCQKPVVAAVQGGAIGGGVGLLATADIVIAAEGTMFSCSEVRLGIIPSVVGPYVIPKIGLAQSRRYFLTGERFDATVAQRLGLVHEVVPAATLGVAVDRIIAQILTGGPRALIAVKAMVCDIAGRVDPQVIDETITQLADIRMTDEAQEGLTAFLEKREPAWCKD